MDGLIRQVVSIDDSQFGFVPGRGTTDAIFVVRQLQGKYLAANKRLYMAFVDLEKVGWLVVFGLNSPLRQYFSLYWAVSPREREKEKRNER